VRNGLVLMIEPVTKNRSYNLFHQGVSVSRETLIELAPNQPPSYLSFTYILFLDKLED
jgi:hypothetical protein